MLELEITHRCNLDCKMCYISEKRQVDMPTETIKQLINFAFKNNVAYLVITGGEALLHPEFPELSKYLQGLKINSATRVVLHSNSILIDDNTLPLLKPFGLIHLSFDLVDFLRKEISHVLDKANLLKEAGINCYLFATIHKCNMHLIDEIIQTSQNEKIDLGLNVMQPNTRSIDYALSKPEFWQVSKKIFELEKQGLILRYTCPLTAILANKKLKNYGGVQGGCTAGIASCSVLPNGEVVPCPFFRIPAGNIANDRLENIWLKSDLFAVLRNRPEYAEPCGSCEYLSFCGGCRSRAYKARESLTACDPMCPFVAEG
ncbi:MAG: radical SAM protein [bacterium]